MSARAPNAAAPRTSPAAAPPATPAPPTTTRCRGSTPPPGRSDQAAVTKETRSTERSPREAEGLRGSRIFIRRWYLIQMAAIEPSRPTIAARRMLRSGLGPPWPSATGGCANLIAELPTADAFYAVAIWMVSVSICLLRTAT